MHLLFALCFLVSSVYAQAPGEVYLTPKIDLQLQPVAVAGMEDRTLNVPPGFVVELFAEDIGKGKQNFPNPFNSQTAIRYTLDRAQEVELKVYTLTGQHVATLISGHRSAGRHVLHWDGRDGQGRPLASGLYLYQLRAGGERQTRKLLLVR